MKFPKERLLKVTEEGRSLFRFENAVQNFNGVLSLVALAGVVYLISPYSGQPRPDGMVQIATLGFLVVFLVLNTIQHFVLGRLRRKWIELERHSTFDGLTRAYNRATFEELLDQEIERANRYRFPLTLCLIDVDDFKKFNDSFGHPRADDLLRKFSEHTNKAIRSSDSLARFGGDEFCILLPHTDLVSAEKFLSRLLTNVQEWVDCTFSAGVTTFRVGESKTDILERADLALYQAKREGKNRIRCMIGEDDTQTVLSF